MSSPLEDIAAPPYRSSIRVATLLLAIGGGFFIASDRANAYVDARVNARVAPTERVIELQIKRLEQMDARMEEMRTKIGEIRVDVATVRTLLEKDK